MENENNSKKKKRRRNDEDSDKLSIPEYYLTESSSTKETVTFY